MNHILVFPNELRAKLVEANSDTAINNKWLNIGVKTVDEMINKIAEKLNTTYPVLSISSIREETEADIKARIESTGNASKFVGYFENERGFVDALFFYIPPNVNNANDFISAKVMPPLFGVYNNIKDSTGDRHIHSMPVFIVNLCTTTRVNNASVKKQIICCETLGFYYLDVFQNTYYDVIAGLDTTGEPVKTKINSLQELDILLGSKTDNKWFEVDTFNKTVKILNETIIGSQNPTSEVYRLSLYVVPALYLAIKEGYSIDISNLSSINGEIMGVFRSFVSKLIK